MNKNKAFLTFQIFSSAFQLLIKNIKFNEVSVNAKANIYFDGKVVSHSIVLEDGTKKTLGLIYPGSYHFNTELAEKMEIIDGNCKVTLHGNEE